MTHTTQSADFLAQLLAEINRDTTQQQSHRALANCFRDITEACRTPAEVGPRLLDATGSKDAAISLLKMMQTATSDMLKTWALCVCLEAEERRATTPSKEGA